MSNIDKIEYNFKKIKNKQEIASRIYKEIICIQIHSYLTKNEINKILINF